MGYRRYDRRRREPQQRINHRIRVPDVRVIDANGDMLGVLATHKAIGRAQEQGLDLVEINPKAKPPVCKILDYGKYKYDEKKKKSETKRKQSIVEVKEVKLRPKTDDHDLAFKARAAQRFLESGNKVKFTVRFRGREITHPQKAREQLDWIVTQCEKIANVEVRPTMEGRTMTMIVSPKPAILQALAASRAVTEKARKEAETARLAKKGRRSSRGASQPGASQAGASQPGASQPGDDDDEASGKEAKAGKAKSGPNEGQSSKADKQAAAPKKKTKGRAMTKKSNKTKGAAAS